MSDPHTSTPPGQAEHEHERVAELLRAVDVRAPARLHQQVQEMVGAKRGVDAKRGSGAKHGSSPTRDLLSRRLKPTLAAMAIAVIAGAAVALFTGTRTQQSPLSMRTASALTLRAATLAAPPESRTHGGQLAMAVNDIAFPYWKDRFGWRSTGARADTIGGRKVTTVFYAGAGGSRIGYAIVAGLPAPSTTGGTVSWQRGVPYRLLRESGLPVVTWQRNGRLCVLSGRGVNSATLLALASWQEPATAS